MSSLTNGINAIFSLIGNSFLREEITTSLIISVLLMVTVISCYQFLVYRLVSHRSFYNRAFNICIAVMPYFISTIILTLQSSLVITLGTIGALALIRFRTAVKDPVDMLYMLWSIHTGIVCGSQLYEVAILTSLAATIVLVLLDLADFKRHPFVAVINAKTTIEDRLDALLKEANVKRYKIKSRNLSANSVNYVIEFATGKPEVITDLFKEEDSIEKFSIIEYDEKDVI